MPFYAHDKSKAGKEPVPPQGHGLSSISAYHRQMALYYRGQGDVAGAREAAQVARRYSKTGANHDTRSHFSAKYGR